MLRLLLAILVAAFIGGAGYYIGRSSAAAQSSGDAKVSRPNFPPPRQSEATRSRIQDAALPNPPDLKPSLELNHPTLPLTEPARAPGESAPLFNRALGSPIVGLKLADIQDTFADARGGGERRHEASDILAPRGTPVVAVDTGIVAKLFNSKAGGLTVYQFDPAQIYAYYYAHLDRYADGLKEGLLLKKGDLVGYVGTTGNAPPNTPHLHFAIFELGPEKHWWQGQAINPYPLLQKAVGK